LPTKPGRAQTRTLDYKLHGITTSFAAVSVPDQPPSSEESDGAENPHQDSEWNACPCCGGRMIFIETFELGCQPRHWPIPSIGLDSS
jgi:hypothetical protein